MPDAFFRSPDRSPWRWRFGQACFDEASLVLTIAGEPVELERRPLELLALLLAHAGEVVTKAEIAAQLWTGREVTEASLTKCMARLRRALGDADHSIVHTVHGYGYRFAAPVTVEEVAASPLPAALELLAGAAVPGCPDWRLQRRLGTGGFGDVWLVRHIDRGDQRVRKFARDAAGVAALRREITLGRLLREALGPREDFLRLLDWDLAQVPYSVTTAWIERGNLADWAAAEGGLAAIDLGVRIELAAQIADALAAAHGVGVLHKDLKPANVLIRVDGQGRPAIILADFGSGRAIEPDRLDALGITRLEPEPTALAAGTGSRMYQAPEAAAGSAPTVQADIFGLGVILYQLAAGDFQRPLAPGWEEQVADPLLRSDIARAAAGDPARRLANAAELSASLRRLPDRRAAAARAEAEAAEAARVRVAFDRARARRGPMRALGAALGLGLAAITVLYLRADRAGAAAQRDAARARVVTSFVTDDLFSAANPVLGGNPNASIRSVLAVATADLGKKFAPGTLDRASVEAAIGGAYAGVADADHARPLLGAALATLRRDLGEGAPETQAVRLTIADLAERMNDVPGVRAAGQAVMNAHPRDTDTELRGRFALYYADCMTGDSDAVCSQKLRPFLAEVQHRTGPVSLLTLRVRDLLAYQLAEGQHFAEATALARETVVLSQSTLSADNLHVQERRYYLAMVLNEAGQQQEAIELLADVRRRLLTLSGGETELSNRVATQLGRAYAAAHRYELALPLLRGALDYNVRNHGEGFEFSRFGMNVLAHALSDSGRPREAVPLGERALALQRTAQGPDNEDTLWIEGNLAEEDRAAGDLARAETLYADIVARCRRVFTHGEWDTGHFEMLLGQVQAQEKKFSDARTSLTDSVHLLSATLGPADARTKAAQSVLADLERGAETARAEMSPPP